MIVIATTYDPNIDNTTANDSALNRYFATPNKNITGKNTITVVIVDANTASATSSAPSRAAAAGLFPSAKCRLMFSSTTTESSTNRPIASAKPPSVITFVVDPFKNNPITNDANTAADPASCSKLSIAARM